MGLLTALGPASKTHLFWLVPVQPARVVKENSAPRRGAWGRKETPDREPGLRKEEASVREAPCLQRRRAGNGEFSGSN